MFSDISSRVQENLAGVRVIRAYAQEDAEVAKFEALNKDYIRENIGLAKIQGLFIPCCRPSSASRSCWCCGRRRQLWQHKITLGSFVMFNTYMGILIWPMIAMGWVVNLMQRGTASLKRINEILHEKPTVARRRRAWPSALDFPGRYLFDDVSVEFDGRRRSRIDSFRSARAKRSRSSATPVAARPRWSTSFRASSIPHRGEFGRSGRASICGSSIRKRCGARLDLCRRKHSSSAPRCPRTLPGACRTHPERIEWAAEVAGLRPTSKLSRMAWKPSSASAALRSPAVKNSAPPSPAPSCAIREFWSSMTLCPALIHSRKKRSWPGWPE